MSAAIPIIPRAQTTGEDGLYDVWLPVGYQYCRSIISTVGVIPGTGEWASSMMAESHSRGIKVRTWTPMYQSNAQSRIEADVTIFGVRDGIADAQRASGKCKRYDVILIACRGILEMNRGQPPCETSVDQLPARSPGKSVCGAAGNNSNATSELSHQKWFRRQCSAGFCQRLAPL